jgi:hypothetical protein
MTNIIRGGQLPLLLATLLMAGCGSRTATVGLQGDVSYQGQAVTWGKIDFLPIETTHGASACSPITNGHYEIPAKWGLLSDGVYEVRIVAFRKTGKMERNRIEIGGPPVETAENYIPEIYNSQSMLKVRVADLPDRNKMDFQLGKPSA